MNYIFKNLDEIIDRIKAYTNVIVLFDYDGTLTPIVDIPEKAFLNNERRKILRELSKKKRFSIGIISGRALSDIKSRVSIDNIIYAGNHGLEIEGPSLAFIHPLTDEVKSTIRIINAVLNKTMGAIKGTIVEDKGLTLSVHYRQVKDDKKQNEVKTVFEKVTGVANMLGKINITSGKKIYEVRPPINWHKGKAVELIIKDYQKGKQNPLVIYAGDDLTDEDAFKALKKFEGISIYIGAVNPESSADYYLKSPDELYKFIEKLLILE